MKTFRAIRAIRAIVVLTILSMSAAVMSFATPLKAQQSGHSVTLSGCTDTWPGVSFNFYRGSTSGGESATALNSSPLATCNYVDTTVQALQTYYYVAKAVCSTCSPSLSGPSNEVSATIPGDPQPPPPTGLTVGPIAKNAVPLHWNPPVVEAGVTVNSYGVFRCFGSGCPHPPQIASVTDTSYVDYPGKGKHWYLVKAFDTVNSKPETSLASNIVEATVTK